MRFAVLIHSPFILNAHKCWFNINNRVICLKYLSFSIHNTPSQCRMHCKRFCYISVCALWNFLFSCTDFTSPSQIRCCLQSMHFLKCYPYEIFVLVIFNWLYSVKIQYVSCWRIRINEFNASMSILFAHRNLFSAITIDWKKKLNFTSHLE